MRLIVNGQQAFGKAALEKILEAGVDEVVAVYTAPDKEGRPVDPMKEAALEHGIPLYQPASYKDQAVLDEMAALNADVMVMAYVIIFIPEVARETPKMGSICFHPSLLPLHRGPSSINWPIIWGSVKSGYSWFYPTDGLDEGDILLQREVEIGPDDTLVDVYFKKIFPAAVDSVLDVLDAFRTGNPPRSSQDESKATYESWCKKADAEIDWSKPAAEVYNLIRGTNPQPGAWSVHDGTEVQIYDSAPVDAEGAAGTVIEVAADSFTVAAGTGAIKVSRVRPKGGQKVAAGEYIGASGLSLGAQLG